MLAQVFQGTTDAAVFEDFIKQLLCHYGRYPEPKSVIIMDNASFYHTKRVEQLCHDAGVQLLYLPPYSPDLNPIEEFFAKLKAYIKQNWNEYAENPSQGFDLFLEWCVDMVRARASSAEGHFRHAGVTVEVVGI
jgi:transposase